MQPSRAAWLPALEDLVEDAQEVWLIFQAYQGQFEAWTLVPVDRAGYLERQRADLRLWPPGKPTT